VLASESEKAICNLGRDRALVSVWSARTLSQPRDAFTLKLVPPFVASLRRNAESMADAPEWRPPLLHGTDEENSLAHRILPTPGHPAVLPMSPVYPLPMYPVWTLGEVRASDETSFRIRNKCLYFLIKVLDYRAFTNYAGIASQSTFEKVSVG
jgi:hypothetical protein